MEGLFQSCFNTLHTDIDECRSEFHTCDSNAMCVNTNGSFECDCKDGFTSDGNNDCIGEYSVVTLSILI